MTNRILINPTTEPQVIVIDLGTSSVRATIWRVTAQRLVVVSQSQISYQMTTTVDGGVTISALELTDLVLAVIDQIVAQIPRNTTITAVAMSTFWHSLLGLDTHYRPTTPLISWNDTRSAVLTAQWREKLDEVALHQRTGCRWHASYWPAKLTWLHQHQPATCLQTRYWVSFADYFYLQLFGDLVTSVSLASATGLNNQLTSSWDLATASLFGLDLTLLPNIQDLTNPLQGLHAPFAQRWPSLTTIPWFLAVGDGACSNIGSNANTPQQVAIMVGTSGALRVVLPNAHNNTAFDLPQGLWSYRIDRNRRVVGGAISNAGDLFAWLCKQLQLPTLNDLDTFLTGLPADGHGLTFLPFLSGERSPHWRDDATGTILGLRLSTTSVEILQAGLEGVAVQFANIYKLVAQFLSQQLKITPQTIFATGGGLYQSVVWRQIIADMLGLPLYLADVSEASSRGAAILALEALNLINPAVIDNVSLIAIHNPNLQRYQQYQQTQQRYHNLYQRLLM
jgi:gluconokinase